MKLVIDVDEFDEIQPWFVGELIESLKRDLEVAGFRGVALKDLCGNLAFTVSAQLDGSAGFQVDGTEYEPILCFSSDQDSMFYPGGSSNLHEYVFGVLDEVFEDDA